MQLTTANLTLPGEYARWMFVRSLKESGLLPLADLERFIELASTVPLDIVCQQLIGEELLNEYQVGRIRSGRADELTLGQYRILDELGSGGFGRVYKARHEIMDRLVAIKILSEDICKDTLSREMFVREVMMMTRLSHPAIAAAYHADEIDGKIFFAMEFVEGLSLLDYITKIGPLPIGKAVSLASQVADALQHAHEIGLVHRDIKPANIMLAGDRERIASCDGGDLKIKVIDFGLASLSKSNARAIATLNCTAGAIVGTPAFISPEQIKDAHDADIRSDLYSLGCTLYYALTGRLPFEGDSAAIMILKHSYQDPIPLQTLNPQIGNSLAAIVARLMQKDPADRFPTPAALIDALRDSDPDRAGQAAFAASEPPRQPIPREAHEQTADVSESPLWISPRTDSSRDLVEIVPVLRDSGIAACETEIEFASTTRTVPALTNGAAVRFDDVRILWTAWYEIVADSRNGGAPTVDELQYGTIYRRLIDALHRMPDESFPGGAIARMQMRAAVEPWVRLASIFQLDRRLQDSLIANCSSIHNSIVPKRRRKSTVAIALAGIALIGFAFALYSSKSLANAMQSFLPHF